MDHGLRNNLSYNKAVFGLSAFSMLFGFITAMAGEILMPLYAGTYAALLMFDKKSKRILSALVPISVTAFSLLIGNLIPVAEVFSVLIAFLVFFMFSKQRTKRECVAYSTVLCTLMILASLVSVALLASGEFSFNSVIDFYKGLYDEIKHAMLRYVEEMTASLPEGAAAAAFTEEDIVNLLDSFILIIPSLIVIVAFVMVGIICKIFSSILSGMINDPKSIFDWRFDTDSIFAYFYIALILLSAFSATNDVFGIAVANLYNVFMVVYAYFGFNFAKAILMRSKSSAASTFILVAIIFLLSGFAVSLLSFLGVYFIIMKNKTFVDKGNEN